MKSEFFFMPRIEGNGFPIGKKKEAPIGILKRRFANGKITEEQYKEPKAILERDGAH